MSAPSNPKPITIAILAMGGEGGGVLADWIVDLAEQEGYLAQTTSVPGVAQRTGSTIYYLELFPESAATAEGRQPVLALMPVPGEVDIVLASELMEAGRAVQRGLVTAERTTLIFSTHRVYSMTERTAMGDGRVDSSALLETCHQAARRTIQADFAEIAEANRSVISAALFGGLAASGALPFERSAFEEAIRRTGVGLESSLAAFAAGFEAPQQSSVAGANAARVPSSNLQTSSLAAHLASEFPQTVREIVAAGVSRLADYQDERYAARYVDRLAPVKAADPQGGDILRETARYLALWMSYEDAIRVADLKIRRERFERIRIETRAEPKQLLHVREFLHPGAQEIADILPVGLGRFLLNSGWARSLITRLAGGGRIVETTSISGYVQLYVIAAMRPLRPRSYRFHQEQERIDAWLREVVALAKEDYALAVRFAECARLLKGYGDTHAVGRRNFDSLSALVPRLRGRTDAAVQLSALCDAALADENGNKLSETMKQVFG